MWSGTSLLGSESPIADTLLGIVASMADHSYGERVDMLEHSLQTAEAAAESGASDELVLAALLHDVGHLLGDAGRWGLADHAAVGARALQQVLPASVIEPIRLHVDAKRHLVTVDARYAEALSEASRQSLEEQGGPFTEAESAAFLKQPWADDAIALRCCDDAGKQAGPPDNNSAQRLDQYARLLRDVLSSESIDGRWWRDICACASCRDTRSGQHLIDVADLAGWHLRGTRDDTAALRRCDGDRHTLVPAAIDVDPVCATTWGSDHHALVMDRRTDAHGDLDQFLSDLSSFGVALATGLDVTPGSVLEFAGRVGFVRNTNYGDLFDVLTKVEANNLAYTSLGLPLHTDNPYRDPVPTVQLLHCLSPAEVGGSSRFSDGFASAQRLRHEQPEAFATLTTTAVDFRFADDDVDLRARFPLIELDVDGEVRAVRVNHRSMVTPPPEPTIGAFYDAYAEFARMLASPEQVIDLDLRSGDIVAFDNRRVLHARSAYSGTTTRHLQGCYIDIDAVHSAARRAASDITDATANR